MVVIYAENRSFDNLCMATSGRANGLQNVSATAAKQLDRDGSTLATPARKSGRSHANGRDAGRHAGDDRPTCRNSPFAIDDPNGFNTPITKTTRSDLYHRFYETRCRSTAARTTSSPHGPIRAASVMGHYTLERRQATAVENRPAVHAGRQLLHGRIRRLVPESPVAQCARARRSIRTRTRARRPARFRQSKADGVTLGSRRTRRASSLNGPPKFVLSGNLTPDFFAINTMQPPYQPSGNKAASGGDANLADRQAATTLPARTQQHIGDLLNNAKVYRGRGTAARGARRCRRRRTARRM